MQLLEEQHGKLNYDSGKVEYVSHSGAATFNPSNGKFIWTDTSGKSSGSIVSVTFKAKAEGSASFSVSVDDSTDPSANSLGAGGGSKAVSIAQPKPSSNANLRNLGIRPNDFSGFRAATTTYNVTVPFSVSAIEVYASVQDSKSKVSGTGKNKSLKEGKNAFPVTVTAEDGTKKTYTINVTRLTEAESPAETPEETPVENTVLGLKSLNIEDSELSPAFSKDVYNYTCEVGADVDKLKIDVEAEEGETVEISGNDNLQPGENTITILVKLIETGETKATYQIIVNKEEAVAPVQDETAAGGTIDQGTKTKIWILVGSIIGIVVIGSGMNILLFIENTKLTAGKISKISKSETPEFSYQSSFTDETDFGSDRGRRGRHL